VDLSLFSGTDVKDDAGEDSASSEDGMNAIRKDLERQKQVSPPSSPMENKKYLSGFMKSPDKQQAEAQAKQASDEDSISLPSSFKQANNGSSAKK
jgi:hypothetical protein